MSTEYVVLRESPGSVTVWQEVGSATATSAKGAIAQCVGEASGTFVAVPARSFQPVKVTVAQKATLSFGAPSKPEPSE